MNGIIAEDMNYISRRIEYEKLDRSRVLISGATGLIGKYLVRFLAEYCNCIVFVIVRDLDKAHHLWKAFGDKVQYIHTDIINLEPSDLAIDYIIHGASNTSSKSFFRASRNYLYCGRRNQKNVGVRPKKSGESICISLDDGGLWNTFC